MMSRRDERKKEFKAKEIYLKQKLAPVIKGIDFIVEQVVTPYLMYLGYLMLPVLLTLIINLSETRIKAIRINELHFTVEQMQQIIHYQRVFWGVLLLLPLSAVFMRLVYQLFIYLKVKGKRDE
ncbi:hypothetical protein [Leuconostoc citreum]|uniref:hypothetical protein n=1 Tax=Leuconostoc citreum TaxID=33964 RepID=UPI0032E02BF2